MTRRATTFGDTQARNYYFQIEEDEIAESEIYFGYAENDEMNEGFLGPLIFDGFLDESPSDKGTDKFRERIQELIEFVKELAK